METTIPLVILAVVGFGVIWLLRSRSKGQADRKDKADRKAKTAQADARAIQKSIDRMR